MGAKKRKYADRTDVSVEDVSQINVETLSIAYMLLPD